MDIIEHYKGKVGNITLGEEQENERISVSKTLTNVDDQQTV